MSIYNNLWFTRNSWLFYKFVDMKLKCQTCNKLKHDTSFNFLKNWFWLDTSKCQECENPKMYDEVRNFFKDLIK